MEEFREIIYKLYELNMAVKETFPIQEEPSLDFFQAGFLSLDRGEEVIDKETGKKGVIIDGIRTNITT